MLRLIKYSFKDKLRDFSLIFWPLIFPLILGTLFYFAFGSSLSSERSFDPVPVAIVEEENADIYFANLTEELEGEYLKATRTSSEEAIKLLEEEKVDGIYIVGEEIELQVVSPSLNTSILAGILSQYVQQRALIEKTAMEHPENLPAAIERMENQIDATNEIALDGSKTNGMNQYFYSLIAMGSMYGAFLGLFLVTRLQANLTQLGARRTITPTHKLKLLFAEMISAFMIHFANVMILVGYLKFILGINLSGGWELVLLVLVGSISGVAMGMLIGSIGRFSEGVKVGISLGISMLGSFLSGLMFGGMKNVVEQHAPIVNKINPASLISDAVYAISVYDNSERFYLNIGILLFESVIFLFVCYLSVRRVRYDSI